MGAAEARQALDDGTAFLRTLQNILDLWRIKQAEMPVEKAIEGSTICLDSWMSRKRS